MVSKSGNKRKPRPAGDPRNRPKKKHQKTDIDLLDDLKELMFEVMTEKLKEGEINLKVGDLVKILEIQRELSSDTSAEARFWEIIEQIRQEELKDA